MATKQATSPSATGRPKYRRVVLKISGEEFGKPGVVGIDGQSIHRISEEVIRVAKLGVQEGDTIRLPKSQSERPRNSVGPSKR